MAIDLASKRRARLVLVVGMLLVAANLRAAASSVGPLLDQIRDDLGLSSTAAGALTTLPVLCFGLIAPLGPPLARRLGYQGAIGAVLIMLIAGLLVRILPGIPPLYIGTMIAGAAIAVGNVLMPPLVRRGFPDHAGAMTGAYTTALVGSAAVAAAVSVPIANAFGGWRAGLGFWALPALVALLAWSPQVRPGRRDEGSAHSAHGLRPLLRDRLAWQVTAYFGFQSASFYIVLSWLPTIFQSHGYSRTTSGLFLGLSLVAGLPGALFMPAVAARAREQGRFAFVYALFVTAGLTGLLVAPRAAPVLWVVLLGIGQQASFPLALIIVVLRSRTLAETAGLSTLMQTVGYLVAAAGPLIAGALHDASDSWKPAILLLFGFTALQVVAGFGAGRDRKLSAPLAGE